MFALESPHRVDSNDYPQYTIFNIKKENPKSAAMCFFLGTREGVCMSHGRQAAVVLLYIFCKGKKPSKYFAKGRNQE